MIKPLTSIRFFFALMVFLHHLGFLRNSSSEFLKDLYNGLFIEGYIGVNFFFILSGFILAYNYKDKLLSKSKPKSEFYIARIARIYPLHLLTLILASPLMISMLQGKSIWESLLILGSNMTLTMSFIPDNDVYLAFNRISWSISDEFFFYLSFPFLILMLHKIIGAGWKYLLILVLWFASIPLLMSVTPEKWHHAIFYINPMFRVADFVIGILLYIAYKRIKTSNLSLNYNVLEVVALGILCMFFLMGNSVPSVYRYSVYYWLPMSMIILAFALQGGAISKLLSHKIFVILGEISFGFYMYHFLTLKYFDITNRRLLHIENDYIVISIVFISTLIISYYSYRYFESPINKFIKKKYAVRYQKLT